MATMFGVADRNQETLRSHLQHAAKLEQSERKVTHWGQ
jgi:hypothetical protein